MSGLRDGGAILEESAFSGSHHSSGRYRSSLTGEAARWSNWRDGVRRRRVPVDGLGTAAVWLGCSQDRFKLLGAQERLNAYLPL